MLLFGGPARVGAQGVPLIMTATSGGQAVTTVPFGSVVTLTVTGGGTQQICISEEVGCIATPQPASGSAVFNFVPSPGCHTYFASPVVGTGTVQPGGVAPSIGTPLIVTAPDTGKKQTVTTIAAGGSAGNYTLTGTVVGYANTAASPASPGGTVSFLDTTNGGAVLGTAPLGAGTAGQNFTNCTTGVTTVGLEPQSVVAADFNGDGISDLAIANLFGPTVTILLGNGDGSFKAGQTLTTGAFPPGIAVGNFGGVHGNTDLVVTNGLTATPQATFFLSNGDGTFTQGPSVAVKGTPGAMVAVALNGTYIAVPNGNSADNATGFVSFLSSASPFPVVQSVPVGDNPEGIVAMSFGVVVTQENDAGTITVLTGAPGSFTVAATLPTGSTPIGIASGDFKSNGQVRDLVVANHNDNTVSIFYGSGTGAFTAGPVLPVGQGPYGVVTGDFNGDGKTDIVVANKIDNTVSVLFGNGDGTFQPGVTLPVGQAPAMPVVGDFSGHGPVDLVVTNTADDTITILPSQIMQTAIATASGISPAGAGAHQVDASYPGDSNYNASVSVATTLSLTAQKVSTNLTLTPNPIASVFGQQVMLSATLSPYNEGGVNTNGETVTFYNGTTSLGTGMLSSGVATLNITSLPLGTDSLTAQFAGDANFTASTSAAVAIMVTQTAVPAPVASLSPSSLTFASQVSGTASSAQTTTLSNTGNAPLSITGAGVAITGANAADFSQTSQCGTSVAAGANCVISVVFKPSLSGGPEAATLNVTDNANGSPQQVQLSGTALPPASVSCTIPAIVLSGNTTTLSIPCTAMNFTGTISLNCNLPASLSAFVSCNFTPSSLVFSSSTTQASTTLTIQLVQAASVERKGRPGHWSPGAVSLGAVFLLPGCLFAFRRKRPGPRRGILLLLLLLCGLQMVTACGGGSGSSSKLPAGSYQASMVLTGPGFSQTITFTVQEP